MSEDIATAISTALAAADDYLAFLAQYRHGDDGPADPATLAGGPEAQRLFNGIAGQPREVYDAVAGRLCEGLAKLPDPFAASLVANQVGSLVEGGLDPVPLAEALRIRLPGDFAAADRFVELLETETGIQSPTKADRETLTRIGRQERTGASAWEALRIVTPAAMAVWSRHRPSRLAAKVASSLAEDAVFLGERGGYCYFIGELLSAADGTQITVLVPEQRKGFVVELEVVRNAAHLFVLLEDTLIGDPDQGLLTGPRTDPKIAAIARGEVELTEAMSFPILWHYEYWFGLAPQGFAKTRGLHPLIAAMIGVEATVHNLPAFDGKPVILMKPALLGSRSCDINFFAPLHDALRSRVTVLRKMPADEVDALCKELKAEAEKLC